MVIELTNAMQKYGELAMYGKDMRKLLEKGCICEEIAMNGITFQQLGLLLVDLGEILEQNEKDRRYVVVVPTGFMKAMRALVVVKSTEKSIYFAAYAHEGLIRQNGARKAIDIIKNNIMEFQCT